MPQCCKTIHIDGSSKNFTIYSYQTDSYQNFKQYDLVCYYTHDQPILWGSNQEYKAYTCKGNPTNPFASWIDELPSGNGGVGFHTVYDGTYSLDSPALIPGQEPPKLFLKFMNHYGFTESDKKEELVIIQSAKMNMPI